ncbi:MAG: hypothetical protein ACR2PH_16525 [Desulfobulbia bacterium]
MGQVRVTAKDIARIFEYDPIKIGRKSDITKESAQDKHTLQNQKDKVLANGNPYPTDFYMQTNTYQEEAPAQDLNMNAFEDFINGLDYQE